MTQASKRFDALDSFRGIAALMVAFHHFMVIDIYSVYAGNVDSEFIKNLWLFTDFFFVLSGFILSYRYYSRGTPFAPLFIARFYRLFPLHIFTTIIFAGLMLYMNMPYMALIPSFFMNIFNLHVFFPDLVRLNMPSWSISVEFYFSIILGSIFLSFRRYMVAISALIVIVSALALTMMTDTLSVTFGIGWIRGVLGLSLGCVAWFLYEKISSYKLSFQYASAVEIILLILLFANIAFYKSSFFLLPLVLYTAMVCVYAREEGCVSSFLKKPYFLKAGILSYSLYLNHLVILFLIQIVLRSIGITHDEIINNSNPWVLPATLVVYFAALVPCSVWTYRHVECYWQKKSGKV